MRIDVFACLNETKADDLAHKTVIVIDALRATSTIVAALAAGCAAVVAAETVGGALAMRRPGDLLGGERYGRKIPGFDFGNSPLEYTDETIAGKRLIMTTTNGTRCVNKACKAEWLLIGSFLNGKACAEAALSLKRDVVILCSGAESQFAFEDGLCAGYIASELLVLLGLLGLPGCETDVGTNDLCMAMIACFKQERSELRETLARSRTGKKLIRLGMENDIDYCARLGETDIVPVAIDGLIVPLQQANRSKTPVHS